MKCHVCGSKMKSIFTNLPFKVDEGVIVIFKEIPVLQCESCSEYLLKDYVLKRVEEMLKKVDPAAELEIIRYAA